MSYNASHTPYNQSSEVRVSMMDSATPPAIAQGVDKNGLLLGRWRRGICSSSFEHPVPNTLMSFFCPGVSFAQISARLGLLSYSYVMLYFILLYALCITAAVTKNHVVIAICVFLSLVLLYSHMRLRWRIRQLFSIPGSILEDFIYATFLGCFSISQMAMHVESYVPGDCTFSARATLPGYRSLN
uniref:Transmembrane protein putative n=1 Tax=Albugo laibachii Nc14 TaxID=890382 RepID=F0WFR2_9STRA|nr:transmembrane protein putative [Albugo laibachii Nc14]|eukprot:CCA20046.1 transmembrane protein putative [Albugo laibachii Nc14]